MPSAKEVLHQVAAETTALPDDHILSAYTAFARAATNLHFNSREAPALQASLHHLTTAQEKMLGAIGSMRAVRTDIDTYLSSVGEAKRPQVTLGGNFTYTHAPEERVQLIGKGMGELRQPCSPNLIEFARTYGPAFREALHDPATREHAIERLEELIHTGPAEAGSTRDARFLNEVGIGLIHEYCAREITALASQPEDILLANRVEDLLFAAYGKYDYSSTTGGNYLRTHASSYISRQLKKWRALANATGPDKAPSGTVHETDKLITEEMDLAASTIINLLHRTSDKASRHAITSVILGLAAPSGTDRRFMDVLIERFIDDRSGPYAFLTTNGLVSEKLLQAWEDGYTDVEKHNPDYGKRGIIRNNIKKILAMEQAERGAAAALHEKLGIRNFGRYPAELLIVANKQLSTPGPLTSYSLHFTATYSHNAAEEPDNNFLDRAQAVATECGHVIIPVEFSSEADIMKAAETIKALGWGPANSIVVNSHGAANRLVRSLEHKRHPVSYRAVTEQQYITVDAIRKRESGDIAATLGSLVKPQGSIFITGCRTGAPDTDGNIAWHIHQGSGRRVVAPSDVTSSELIPPHIDRQSGELVLDVMFWDRWGAFHAPTVYDARRAI